jgi:hypothetical protein
MDSIAGLVYVAAGLLALAGVAKLARPAPTAGALRALHLPGPIAGVRALGVVELVLGAAAIVTGAAPVLGLVALAYVAFTVFVIAARRAGTNVQSCGCFGSVDTPPSTIHVGLDLGCAAVCATAAVRGLGSFATVRADQPWAGVPLVLLVVVGVYLAYQLLTLLPVTLQLTRG